MRETIDHYKEFMLKLYNEYIGSTFSRWNLVARSIMQYSKFIAVRYNLPIKKFVSKILN